MNLSSNDHDGTMMSESQLKRRDIFKKASFAILGVNTFGQNAMAFPNKISDKYDDRPKRRGPQPKDLGLGQRKDIDGEPYIGLKQCGPAPNCFCSTDKIEEDPEHNIPSFKWPSSISSKKEAFTQLLSVIEAYEPGQKNIDGGGFKVISSDLEKGYIYAQFESLKNGYIDDFELASLDDKTNEVQVRSSSRVGYLDFGVNAKRINFIAKKLKSLGWDAIGVDPDTHQDYVVQNSQG